MLCRGSQRTTPRMRVPLRTTPQHPLRKGIAAVLIALAAVGISIAAFHVPGAKIAMSGLDTTLYDAFYRFRKPEDRTSQPIVIVTVDESSIRKLSQLGREWPWQRDIWAATVKYMEASGAKALVFDVQFQDKRNYDKEFGSALDNAKIPVILATRAQSDGKPDAFAPNVKRPMTFGATNLLEQRVARQYAWDVNGLPSLAVATANAVGAPKWSWAGRPFLLRFFGPYMRPDGQKTYTYLEAASVCKAASVPKSGPSMGIFPEMFRDKIVLIGGTAVGTFDLKSSPLSSIYPGVEIHATAIDDLLTGQVVQPVAPINAALSALFAAMIAAVGVILPRRVTLKILFAAIAAALLVGFSITIFVGHNIHWLPMASPIVALLLATIGAFAWSYLTEDRQRRFVLKALSQYLSPDVAAEISRNPDSLKLGGDRREMTVLFSDIQGFTDLSESMPSEKLSTVLNYYLGEMSGVILKEDGTLDKYIGDAIMSFWNAPLLQSTHAALACRAALAMRDREKEIQPELAALGAKGLLTRIGINSGPMVVGNMGSAQKFNSSEE